MGTMTLNTLFPKQQEQAQLICICLDVKIQDEKRPLMYVFF
jgi:hypothetical protein